MNQLIKTIQNSIGYKPQADNRCSKCAHAIRNDEDIELPGYKCGLVSNLVVFDVSDEGVCRKFSEDKSCHA